MEKTKSALMVAISPLLENTPTATSFPFVGVISLCLVLHWLVTTLNHFYSLLIHSLITTVKSFRAEEKKNTIVSGVTTPSEPYSDVDEDKLFRSEVEVVMGKLGFSYDPNGGEIEERVGLEEIEALLGEEVSLEDVEEAFDVFDENSDGFIDSNELKKVLCVLGFQEVSEMECDKMIRAFDDNGDGRIDFGEFKKLLESTSC
ncbi:unnamed protein product [Camellia sinensis]